MWNILWKKRIKSKKTDKIIELVKIYGQIPQQEMPKAILCLEKICWKNPWDYLIKNFKKFEDFWLKFANRDGPHSDTEPGLGMGAQMDWREVQPAEHAEAVGADRSQCK